MKTRKFAGFTIVETLVVVVVIGILVSMTVISYNGITQKAIVSSLTSDLSKASDQIKLYYLDHHKYPTDNKCPSPGLTEVCLKSSDGNLLSYNSASPYSLFLLTAERGTTKYYIINDSIPKPTGSLAAAGGTITYLDSNGLNPRSSPSYPGGYTVHTFSTNGSFTISSGVALVSYLVVSNGASGTYNVGPGGAGGKVLSGSEVVYDTKSVVVGAISSFGSNIASGAGAAGGSCEGCAGTAGTSSSISGVSKFYGGGGGAGSNTTGGAGGSGGGGAGGSGYTDGTSGQSGTGGGGGGGGVYWDDGYGSGGGYGGGGGSGIVIIRYQNS